MFRERSVFGAQLSGDQSNTDPKLGPLQDNGGPTRTHALQSGSPAIDTADPATCPSTDQRGFRRESSHCAKGAFQNVGAATALVAAVTPDTRSGTVGNAVTAFLTAINTGSTNARLCGIAPFAVGPYTFAFQTTNPQNQITGTPNQPVDIGPGQAQNFIIAFTPTAAFARVSVPLSVACTNSTPAPIVSGVNRMSLAASATPIPDPVVITLTPSHDGILRLNTAGNGFFVAATVNVGAAGIMTASIDSGGLPASFVLCKTNPATSACLAPPTAQVTSPMAANETATYGIFGVGLAIPFDPAQNRVTFSLEGGGGKGGASVAVCRDPSCP